MKTLAALLMLSVAMPAPAFADDPDVDPVVKEEQLRTARIEAKTARIQAETARAEAQLAALGLKTDATGKTTLHEKGGELEAWMLSTQAIDQAANSIAGAVNAVSKDRPVILLDATEAFDLSVYSVVKARLGALSTRFEDLLASDICKPKGSGGTGAGTASAGGATVAGLPALIPLAGALVGALKTDTDIYGADGPTSSRLLVNAVAQRSGSWIVPGDVSLMQADSKLAKQWDALKSRRGSLAACAMKLTAEAEKPKLAMVTATIAAFDDFETQAVGDGGATSLLVQAVREESLAGQNPLVLRLFVEKAGGTILVRKNLWTALGASAVGVTGGATVSWRLVEPSTGHAVGGVLRCHTALSSLRSIQAGEIASRICLTSN